MSENPHPREKRSRDENERRITELQDRRRRLAAEARAIQDRNRQLAAEEDRLAAAILDRRRLLAAEVQANQAAEEAAEAEFQALTSGGELS